VADTGTELGVRHCNAELRSHNSGADCQMSQQRGRGVTVIGVVLLLSWFLSYYTSSRLPSVPAHTESHQFKIKNAREYLDKITALGPRVTGEAIVII
jgi:hypothetical protein